MKEMEVKKSIFYIVIFIVAFASVISVFDAWSSYPLSERIQTSLFLIFPLTLLALRLYFAKAISLITILYAITLAIGLYFTVADVYGRGADHAVFMVFSIFVLYLFTLIISLFFGYKNSNKRIQDDGSPAAPASDS
jgi:hypothetical protein